MLHLSIEINGFSDENVVLQGGLRGGYYGGYFEHYVIRDISYGLWTDARHKNGEQYCGTGALKSGAHQ